MAAVFGPGVTKGVGTLGVKVLQREDAHPHQIGAVDALKDFCNHSSENSRLLHPKMQLKGSTCASAYVTSHIQ